MVKNPPDNAGDIRDVRLIPGLGRTPGGGHGYPLQYSCLKDPMDRGAWRAMVHGVTKSQTQLKRLSSGSIWRTLQPHKPSPQTHRCQNQTELKFVIISGLVLIWGLCT